MGENTRIEKAIALTEGRLHTAVGDKRCGCGPCAHQVAMAARRAGVTQEQLQAALPPAARPEPGARRRRPGGPLGPISESCTVRMRGRGADPREGVALLAERLHSSG